MTRYAINIADMMHDKLKVPVQMMVGPVTGGRQIVWPDKSRPDTQAVVLECDEERALAICCFLSEEAEKRGIIVRYYEASELKSTWRERRT